MAITKKASMDPEQSVPHSPARPIVREWHIGSYEANGLPANFDRRGPKQMPKTEKDYSSSKRPTKPGRW